jgi:hypothetical protein
MMSIAVLMTARPPAVMKAAFAPLAILSFWLKSSMLDWRVSPLGFTWDRIPSNPPVAAAVSARTPVP